MRHLVIISWFTGTRKYITFLVLLYFILFHFIFIRLKSSNGRGLSNNWFKIMGLRVSCTSHHFEKVFLEKNLDHYWALVAVAVGLESVFHWCQWHQWTLTCEKTLELKTREKPLLTSFSTITRHKRDGYLYQAKSMTFGLLDVTWDLSVNNNNNLSESETWSLIQSNRKRNLLNLNLPSMFDYNLRFIQEINCKVSLICFCRKSFLVFLLQIYSTFLPFDFDLLSSYK